MPDRKVRTDTPGSWGGRHIRATAETRRPAGGKERRTRGSEGGGPRADSDTDTGTCVRDGGDASPSEASDGHTGSSSPRPPRLNTKKNKPPNPPQTLL